jgi:hypothetical protein
METIRKKLFRMKLIAAKFYRAAGAAVFLFAAMNNRAQQQGPLGGVKDLHATDFTQEQYYEQPNGQQVKMRLSGAAAAPLPGGLLDVKELKVELFSTNGLLQAVAQAPQCTYAPLDNWASSAGRLEVWSADGKYRIEGEGFLLRQTNSSLTISISNHVHTVIEIPADNHGSFL